MRILLWHVHGSWTTAFVQGRHTYLLPVLPDRGPDGRGRARTWCWPGSVEEVTPGQARHTDVDLVILQRPDELAHLAHRWLGRHPGVDVPAVYLEHDAPPAATGYATHPAGARPDIPLVHVTNFNQVYWDSGKATTRVIEHGIVDPGHRWTGHLPSAAVVVNDPLTRGRVVGADLVEAMREHLPIEVFGMGTEPIGGTDLPQDRLHEDMAERRLYLHPNRWTSLGLSLIEAMHLGMPVVALAATEVPEAVPPTAGVVSSRPDTLIEAARRLLADRDEAAVLGAGARQAALARFGLERFLGDWDQLIEEVTR